MHTYVILHFIYHWQLACWQLKFNSNTFSFLSYFLFCRKILLQILRSHKVFHFIRVCSNLSRVKTLVTWKNVLIQSLNTSAETINKQTNQDLLLKLKSIMLISFWQDTWLKQNIFRTLYENYLAGDKWKCLVMTLD